MNRFTERRKFSLEQRLADAYEFIEDPGNWSALDGRRALLMQILRPNGADTEATNEKPVSHIRFYKGIPIAVVTGDGKVRTVQERPEDRKFFDLEGFVGVKPPHDPEVPATNGPVAVAQNTLSYAATALEASADNGDRYCASQIRAALAEVPADEGTLRERLVAARLSSVAFRASDGIMSVGIRTNEEAADAALEVFATELQKARAEGNHAATIAQLHDIAMTTSMSLSMVMEAAGIFTELDSLRAKLTTIDALLSSLDLDGAITRPGTAWGSILREALATARSQEPPTGQEQP